MLHEDAEIQGDWCEYGQCRNMCQQASALWQAYVESSAHSELGKQFLELSRECHDMINEEAEVLWLVA